MPAPAKAGSVIPQTAICGMAKPAQPRVVTVFQSDAWCPRRPSVWFTFGKVHSLPGALQCRTGNSCQHVVNTMKLNPPHELRKVAGLTPGDSSRAEGEPAPTSASLERRLAAWPMPFPNWTIWWRANCGPICACAGPVIQTPLRAARLPTAAPRCCSCSAGCRAIGSVTLLCVLGERQEPQCGHNFTYGHGPKTGILS